MPKFIISTGILEVVNKLIKSTTLFALILVSQLAYSQIDTIRFLKGKSMFANVTGVSQTSITYSSYINERDKIINKSGSIEGYRVYSVTTDTGKTILYEQDSTIGNTLSVENMDYFIKGEEHAFANYKTAPMFIGSIAVGLGVVMYDTYLSKADAANGQTAGFFKSDPSIFPLVTTFLYTAAIGIPKVALKTSTVRDKSLLMDPYFLDGYERTGRSRRVITGLKGKALGVVLGLGTHLLLNL